MAGKLESAPGAALAGRLPRAATFILALLMLAGSGAAGAALAISMAPAGKTHSKKIAACSLLSTREASAALGFPATTTTPPEGKTFVPGGTLSSCVYEGKETSTSGDGPIYSISLMQRDYAQHSWSAGAAKKQFAHGKSFLKPTTDVGGLGDASFWSPIPSGDGAVWTLWGDLVLDVGGTTAHGKASQSLDEAIMKKLLARV